MKLQIHSLCGLFCAVLVTIFLSSCSTKEKEMPITTSSDEAKQLFIQGREDLFNAETEKAAQLFEDAINKDSTFALAYLLRAFSGGGREVLKSNLEKAVLLSDKVTEGEQLLIKANKASNIDNDRNLAGEYLKKLLTMFPGDKFAHFSYALSFFNQGENDSAITYLKNTIELDAVFAPAHNILGYAYMSKGENEEAEKEFKEYIRLAPERPNPYDSYGEFLLKVGRYDESIENYLKSNEIDPSFTTAFLAAGDNYTFKGDYAKARDHYQKYFDNSKTVTAKLDALNRKARSYLYENKLDEALKSYENVKAFAEKENKAVENMWTNFYQGFALSEFGKTAEGLKKFQESIKLIDKIGLNEKDRDYFKVLSNNLMAYAYTMNNDLSKAKHEADIFRKSVEKTDDASLKEMADFGIIGFMAFKKGDYKSTIEKFKMLSKPDAQDKYYLAQAYFKSGNKEAANKLFNEIINSNENTIQLAVVWNKVKQELGKK